MIWNPGKKPYAIGGTLYATSIIGTITFGTMAALIFQPIVWFVVFLLESVFVRNNIYSSGTSALIALWLSFFPMILFATWLTVIRARVVGFSIVTGLAMVALLGATALGFAMQNRPMTVLFLICVMVLVASLAIARPKKDSVDPSKETKSEAAVRIFLGRMHDPIPFHRGRNSHGGIDLYWNHAGGTVDLGFDRDGVRSFFARMPDNTEFLEDAGKADDPLPPAMHAYLNRTT